ncbi:hypothetical protein ANN_03425 [Periplaneta americana]|uniref:G patch domain-containing protein 11 n=1 Tax=Periplaneta americana TaxID=6978 RepID=A0ABQ8U0T6_PERAM|nr:hypothetical protein ANN_03425 [Periplaneta americana]
MPSDDEFDYMSDNFLAQCVKEDIRPGLIHNRTQKRTHDIHKKKTFTDEENKQRNKPLKLVEAERREEGLNEAICDNNRGFSLLQKMGYKPGMAIGKSGTGRVEPIPIAVKSDRGGLGREAALKEIAAHKQAIRNRLAHQREKATSTEDYRARLAKKAAERHTEGDLRKSQRICEQLDTTAGCNEPVKPWFWPANKTKGGDEIDEDEPEDPENEIRQKNCHTEGKEEDEEEEEEEEEEEIEFESSEKLEILTLYLRKEYCYCIWCGVQYDDEKDLQKSCPGLTRDEH